MRTPSLSSLPSNAMRRERFAVAEGIATACARLWGRSGCSSSQGGRDLSCHQSSILESSIYLDLEIMQDVELQAEAESAELQVFFDVVLVTAQHLQ